MLSSPHIRVLSVGLRRGFTAYRCFPLRCSSEALLYKGKLALRRDQQGYDVKTPEKKIQVKYVLNDGDKHPIKRKDDWDLYAVVLFRKGRIHLVCVFPNSDWTDIYWAFTIARKNRKNPGMGFDLTERRFSQLETQKQRFEQLGMRIWTREDLEAEGVSTQFYEDSNHA